MLIKKNLKIKIFFPKDFIYIYMYKDTHTKLQEHLLLYEHSDMSHEELTTLVKNTTCILRCENKLQQVTTRNQGTVRVISYHQQGGTRCAIIVINI